MCLSGLPFLWFIQISPILFLLSPRFLKHHFVFPQPPTSSRCSAFQIPLALASEGFPCFISPHLPVSIMSSASQYLLSFIKIHQHDLKRLLCFHWLHVEPIQLPSGHGKRMDFEITDPSSHRGCALCSLCDLNKLPSLDFSYLILKLG